MNKAVFLDRDGVITKEPPYYAHKIDQLELIPKSAEAIRLLNESGFKVIIISNQSGVARGYYQEKDIKIYNNEMKRQLEEKGARIDAIYCCPHHPEAVIEKYKIDCDCRKPKPGMLRQAEKDLNLDLKRSFLIGDKMSDIEAGYRAGCKTILVLTGQGNGELKKISEMNIKPNYISKDLYTAIKIINRNSKGKEDNINIAKEMIEGEKSMINKNAKIFIAGHEDMIGAALVRCLKTMGFNNLITKSFSQLKLTNQSEVRKFFLQKEPEYVFLTPIKEGGILANTTYPAELIYTNLQVQTNLVHFAWETKVRKLLFLGSSCIYPKFCSQPMREEALLTGLLEPTNEAYAIAKIAGIKMCQAYNKQYNTNFISVIPTNIYGPYDNFDLETSHVIPGLIRKFHQAKVEKKEEVIIWGSGNPRREFLYVDDFADACIFLMNNYNQSEIINVGYGKDISIRELASIIKEITEFDGELNFDNTKPDGMPYKLLDTTKMNKLDWSAKTDLKKGLKKTYTWFEKTRS